MQYLKILIFIVSLTANTVTAKNISNFFEAKKAIMPFFLEMPETLYCGCSFDKNIKLLKKSCSINATKYIDRANRIEMEHMFAMSHAKHNFTCWRFGGRKNCQKTDPNFNKFEAELYNLWPVIGSINALRSDFRYTEFSLAEKERLGWIDGCHIYIDSKLRQVEPRNEIKGIIARANLFISEHYKIKLSKQQRRLFISWNNKFPPNHLELQWANAVAKIQGYQNLYIVNYKKLKMP